MYDAGKHTEVEAFIMSWTLKLVFLGVTLTFIVKLLALLGLYVTSGKMITDFGTYIWKGITSLIKGGM